MRVIKGIRTVKPGRDQTQMHVKVVVGGTNTGFGTVRGPVIRETVRVLYRTDRVR